MTRCLENSGDFLKYYAPAPSFYDQKDPARVAVMLKRGAELAKFGVRWCAPPTIHGGKIPSPPTNLRVTPKY